MEIRLSAQPYSELIEHAQASYPQEACGLLGGLRSDAGPILKVYRPMRNLAEGPDRFAMDPLQVARCEHSFRQDGLLLLATFHSHPDLEAVPSEDDIESAWPELWYLIGGVSAAGRKVELRAWRLGAPAKEVNLLWSGLD